MEEKYVFINFLPKKKKKLKVFPIFSIEEYKIPTNK